MNILILTASAVFLFITTAIIYVFSIPQQMENSRYEELLSRVDSPAMQRDNSSIRKQVLLSDIPFVHSLLTRINFFLELGVSLQQLGLKIKVAFFIFVSFALLFVTPILLSIMQYPAWMGIGLGIVLACIPFTFIEIQKIKRLKRFEMYFPEALSIITHALKAGQGLNSALEAVACDGRSPVKEEFAHITQKLSLGIDFKELMIDFAYRNKIEETKFFSSAVLIQKESGGNLAEVLTIIENIIRERFSMRREFSVLSAQGRLSGMILMFIPIGLGMVLSVSSPGYLEFFVETKEGNIILLAIILLNIIGFICIQKIIKIKI